MTERIILSIIAILMLALTIKKGDKLSILLTAGLSIGILMNWTMIPLIINFGLVLYTVSTLLISLTNIKNNELTKLNRAIIVLTGIFAFGANLFSIMHWPYAEKIRLSMLIPIILYLVSVFNGLLRRKELGYMTIINTKFIMQLIG